MHLCVWINNIHTRIYIWLAENETKNTPHTFPLYIIRVSKKSGKMSNILEPFRDLFWKVSETFSASFNPHLCFCLQVLLWLWRGDSVEPLHTSRRADARHRHAVRLGASYRVQHAAAQLKRSRSEPTDSMCSWDYTLEIIQFYSNKLLETESIA